MDENSVNPYAPAHRDDPVVIITFGCPICHEPLETENQNNPVVTLESCTEHLPNFAEENKHTFHTACLKLCISMPLMQKTC